MIIFFFRNTNTNTNTNTQIQLVTKVPGRPNLIAGGSTLSKNYITKCSIPKYRNTNKNTNTNTVLVEQRDHYKPGLSVEYTLE